MWRLFVAFYRFAQVGQQQFTFYRFAQVVLVVITQHGFAVQWRREVGSNMGLLDFNISMDAASLGEIARMQGVSALLDPGITAGLAQAGQLLVGAAQANTQSAFMNPTGALAGSIYFYVISPDEVAVAVGVPYGHRREYSFKGPDSLGRMFPNDPAEPYLQPAVDDNQSQVEAIMAAAVNSALGRIPA